MDADRPRPGPDRRDGRARAARRGRRALAEVIRRGLVAAGFVVDVSHNGEDALLGRRERRLRRRRARHHAAAAQRLQGGRAHAAAPRGLDPGAHAHRERTATTTRSTPSTSAPTTTSPSRSASSSSSPGCGPSSAAAPRAAGVSVRPGTSPSTRPPRHVDAARYRRRADAQGVRSCWSTSCRTRASRPSPSPDPRRTCGTRPTRATRTSSRCTSGTSARRSTPRSGVTRSETVRGVGYRLAADRRLSSALTLRRAAPGAVT